MAALYRGLATSERPTLTEPPVIHSYLKDISVLSSEKVQKAREYKLTAFYLAVETETNAASDAEQPPQPPKPPVLGRTVRFSGDNLQALKQLASDPTGAGWVSTFEALSAFLCQWNYRIRLQHFMSQGTSEKEAAGKIVRGFWASINMRGPTRLNLSPRYLPNAVYPPYASFPHELLANEPLWKVAEALHGLIRGFDTHKIKMSTRWIAAQPNKSRIRVDFSFFDGNFTVSQWAAFSMYVGVDFDADEDGKPVPPALVGQPYTEISRVDGLGMFQSTEEEFYRTMENGGDAKKPCAFDVKLTFSEPLWEILDQEEEFWRYCS
ncbi:hypothetical protein SI65_02375 [Aspergillus cristatus]|uniref:Uncharacterized protein n=1 Tax=Aspergillus cristatus TaxID=573508 RepID=A0A1E3BL53_ASPCR|nr:hypothetical protein SI65_02375 [Aspergillus cristatus]